jgi:hypothetical protein
MQALWQMTLKFAADKIRLWSEDVEQPFADEYWRIAFDLEALAELSAMQEWIVDDLGEDPESEPGCDGIDLEACPVAGGGQEAEESEEQQDECDDVHALSVQVDTPVIP